MTIWAVLLAFLAITGILFMLARVVHATFYEMVPGALLWRAPLAALVLWLFTMLLPWIVNEVKGTLVWPITWNELFFGQLVLDTEEVEFTEFRVTRNDGLELVYRRERIIQGVRQMLIFRDDAGRAMPMGELNFTGVAEDGKRIKFETMLNAEGNIDRGKDGLKEVRYRAEDGRIMEDTQFGKLSSNTRYAQWAMFWVLMLNLALWVTALWLGCQLEFKHAFAVGLPACLFWLFVLNLFVG